MFFVCAIFINMFLWCVDISSCLIVVYPVPLSWHLLRHCSAFFLWVYTVFYKNNRFDFFTIFAKLWKIFQKIIQSVWRKMCFSSITNSHIQYTLLVNNYLIQVALLTLSGQRGRCRNIKGEIQVLGLSLARVGFLPAETCFCQTCGLNRFKPD